MAPILGTTPDGARKFVAPMLGTEPTEVRHQRRPTDRRDAHGYHRGREGGAGEEGGEGRKGDYRGIDR
nr:MAG TPA: hypothetical protein [Caudoviricetes sp.]DAR13934.1 MAG TPA: hypothetical protein [Caudoviricetes sp.]